MSGQQTGLDLDAIEHLDFAPPCQATWNSCNSRNSASCLVVNHWCHAWEKFFCSDCVSRKIAHHPYWKCSVCGSRVRLPWLSLVTLHPLRPTS